MVATRLHARSEIGPGLAVAAAGGAAALGVHAVAPALSPALVAIVLGVALAASGAIGRELRPGLGVASRRVLRIGVALLGLQLSLPQIVALGWPVLIVVAGVVGLGITLTLALARRLGVPGDTALLIACGFSICGAAAVAAVDGVRRGKDQAGEAGSTATVVSLVVVFGSAAMLLIPVLAGVAGFDQVAAGAWSGASIHEVGQVVVAGGIVGAAAVPVAVAVKLARVLMLAPVLAVLSVRSRRHAVVRPPLVPGFVAAFLACVLARTVLPLPAAMLDAATLVQAGALAAAMFALGCALDPAALRRTGAPVLALAAGATVLVSLLGLPAAFVAG